MNRSAVETVGIDFGTSTCFIAREFDHGEVEVLPIGRGRRYLASLAGHLGGTFVVGEDAEVLTPDRVIRSVKTAITENRVQVTVGGRDGSTEVDRDEVVAAIFREVVKRAHDHHWPLDHSQRVRLGCPAMWMRPQRILLTELAASAGLQIDDSDLIEEPVAAGIAWLNRLRQMNQPFNGRMLVFDMGGGTLDIAVMQVTGWDPPNVAVLTSVGLPLAGDALDEAIVRDLCQERGIDLDQVNDSLSARADLLQQAVSTKVALSSAHAQTVYFEPFYYGAKIAPVKYTRDRLNDLFRAQMTAAEELTWRALRLARLTHLGGASIREILALTERDLANDVDLVLLVGGMARLPYVRDRLGSLFPGALFNDQSSSQIDEMIVAGIADNTGYNSMNMYRPNIDVDLTWGTDDRIPLYEAYTPLFEVWQLQAGQSHLGFGTRVGERQGIPRQRRGELRITTAAGTPAELVHTGQTARPTSEIVKALTVPFGHYEIVFKLYCDGHIHLTDGTGHDHEVRINGWPVIGPVPARLMPPDPPVHYPFNRP